MSHIHDLSTSYETLLRARRSVRGFLPAPVPESLIERIFEMAQFAPSNCNVQPWAVHVVSGDACERLRSALHDAAASDARMTPDIMITQGYAGAYRTRQVESAKALFAATGVARDDRAARRESFLRNYRFFDAPHAAFIFMPDWAGIREAGDCGIYAQSLMLALVANGLASCPQGALSHHAEIVRRELGIGTDLKLLFGIAFGYEDVDHPANATRTDRAGLDSAVTFHSS